MQSGTLWLPDGVSASVEKLYTPGYNFGKFYDKLPNMQNFATNVLRLEMFDSEFAVDNQNAIEFIWYVPEVKTLKIFRSPFNDGNPIDIETEFGEITHLGEQDSSKVGYWSVKLRFANGDFIGAEDKYECDEVFNGGCHNYAKCIEKINSPPICECFENFAISSDGVTRMYDPNVNPEEICVMLGHSIGKAVTVEDLIYQRNELKTLIKLSNMDMVENGWGVTQILMYY